MKSKLCVLVAVAAYGSVVAPTSVFAQEYGPDDSTSINVVEEQKEEAKAETKTPEEGREGAEEQEKLSWSFRLTNEFHAFDNLDLLPLDETSPQRILQTDDRQNFGYTSISAGVTYDVLPSTAINFGGVMSGMWGNDQVGASTEFNAPIYVYDLSIDWTIFERGDMSVSTTIGRQGFAIGGADKDFFFNDIIDGVTVAADLGRAGALRVLLVDVFGEAGRPRNVDFLNYIGANQQTTNNFRGDTDVIRYGGVYELTDIVGGLDLRAFGFGAYIGAARGAQLEDETTTGTDISGAGSIENFADEDYNFMYGGRANYSVEADDFELGVMAEYARSNGKDRKSTQVGNYDVESDGNAYGAGISALGRLGVVDIDGRVRFFRADGSQHTGEDGLLFNHGFTSMKGSEIGGINMERYAGWHPSSYVSGFKGVFDNPQDIDRKSGTMTLHGGLGLSFVDTLRLDLDAWYFRDTSETNFDGQNVEAVAADSPFGISSADLNAQERLGKTLGTELDAAVTFLANDALTLYAIGGIFMPGDFYNTRIQRTAGTSLGAPSSDPDQLEQFWVAAGGATLAF